MEDFVPFEIAKKLEEKGFREKCYRHCYPDSKDWFLSSSPECGNYSSYLDIPTISQVLKWLREAKKIYVSVEVEREDWFESKIVQTIKNTRRTGTRVYETYAEAVLAGIEYVIDNLI